MKEDKRSHEEIIDEMVERANKNGYEPGGMYTHDEQADRDFHRIMELVIEKLCNDDFDTKNNTTKHISIDDAIKVFYK